MSKTAKTSPTSSSSASPSSVAAEPATYEAALQELEQLVAALDAGQLPLDQLLTQYQRGAQLLAFCRSRLDAVEQQIRVFEQNDTTSGADPTKAWTDD